MATPSGERVPSYIPFVILEQDGHRTNIELKAWSSDDGVVWEMRRVLKILLPNRGAFKVGTLLTRDLADLRKMLVSLGYPLDAVIRPSVRAAAHSAREAGEYVNAEEDLREEWTCSTAVVIVMLLWWAHCRKMVRERKLAVMLLAAFLQTLLKADKVEEIMPNRMHESHKPLCTAAPVECGMCCHANALRTEMGVADTEGTLWERLASKLRAMFGMALQCKALAAWLGQLSMHIGYLCEDGVANGPWNHDPLRAESILRGQKRRLRIDEDFKRATMRAAEHGRAGSSRQLARALGEVHPSLGDKWSREELSAFVCSGWMTFERCRTLSIAPDASRFGNPAEDTLAIPVYSPDNDYGHWCPPQVLRDYISTAKPPGQRASDQDIVLWNQRIAAFFKEQVESVKLPKKPFVRIPNMVYLKAIDHGLQCGLKVELKSFVPEVPLKPLEHSAQRYFASSGDLPEWAKELGQLQRSCLLGKDDQRRLELQGFDDCKVLHVCSDQGSVGWPCWHFLFTRAGLFGTISWDVHHRTWGDVKNAVKSCDLFVHLLTSILVYNISSGPWDGSAFFQDLRGAAAQFFKNETIDSPFFTIFYEAISRDMNMFQAHNYGTRAHMTEVYQRIKYHEMFHSKGQKVKLSRWFSVFDTAEEFSGKWATAGMLLCYMMVSNNIVASADALPIYGSRFAPLAMEDSAPQQPLAIEGPAVPAALPSEAGAGGVGGGASSSAAIVPLPRDVKHSNEVAERLKRQSKYKNQLHMGAAVLANRGFRRLVDMMRFAIDPIRRQHQEAVADLKTRRGCLEYSVSMADMRWMSDLDGTLSVLSDRVSLEALDFDCGPALAADGNEVQEDLDLAQHLVKLVVALTGIRLMTNLTFSHSLPGAFCGLIHRDEEVARMNLEQLEEWWRLLTGAEDAARGNPHLRSLLGELAWPSQQYVRYVFVTLSEFGFKQVPPHLEKLIREYASSMRSTKVTEDCFHDLRAMEKANPSGHLSRETRWQRSLTSHHLADSDRRPLRVTPAATMAAKGLRDKLPKALFDAEGSKCSLSDEQLDELIDPLAKYPSPSPQEQLKSPVLWECISQCDGDYELLTMLWLNLLLQVGSYIFKETGDVLDKAGGIVVSSTQFGAVLWHAHRDGGSEHDPLKLKPELQGMPRFRVLNLGGDLESWKVRESYVVTPAQLARRRAAAGLPPLPPQVGILLGAGTDSIIARAAKSAFKGMSVPLLHKLMRHIGMRHSGRRPVKEMDVVAALAKHALPDLTDEGLHEILKLRADRCRVSVSATPLDDPENVELGRDLIDEGDLKESKKPLERAHKRLEHGGKGGSGGPNAKKPASGGASASSGVDAPAGASVQGARGAGASEALALAEKPRVPLPSIPAGSECYDLAEFQGFLPQLPGCRLLRETKWHSRVRVTYPKCAGTSKTYGNEVTELSAIMFCLRFAWRVHTDETNEVCPWQLGE